MSIGTLLMRLAHAVGASQVAPRSDGYTYIIYRSVKRIDKGTLDGTAHAERKNGKKVVMKKTALCFCDESTPLPI